jgi:heat shock protein HtpX
VATTSTLSFSIETEVAPAYYPELLDYIQQKYVQPSSQRFSEVKRSTIDGDYVLDFSYLDPQGKWRVDINVKTGKPVQVMMTPSQGDVPQSLLDRLKEDFVIVVQYFEENVRRSTLYFAWVQGKDVVPEKSPLRRAKIMERIFFGNVLFLFVLIIGVSIVLVLTIGLLYTAIFIVVSQLIVVALSDRLIGTLSDWRITKENPTVHILQYHLPAQERVDFTQKYPREKLLQMKKEIYDITIALRKPIEVEPCAQVMSKYGLSCAPGNMTTKTLNVYDLVQKATQKYGFNVPKIALSNTMIPNAAASGPAPSHAIVLITTGLLVQLDEPEILSVLGHEISHLHARDPFVLSGIVSTEYILRIFVFLPYLESFGVIFLYVYLVLILGLIFFVAKFFEARADLESALRIGNPKTLAEGLRKIGFRRLQFERSQSHRVQDWITWDPHPPIYFRIERLEKLDTSREIRHTLIQSAKDCLRGFVASF